MHTNTAGTTPETKAQAAVQKVHYEFMEIPAQLIQFPAQGRQCESGRQRWYLLMSSFDVVQGCEHCQGQQQTHQDPSATPQS